jgi:haloalkane dehalogenase
MHYVDEGPGAGRGSGTVVFSHGTPTWSFGWRHLIATLRRSHRCLALDHLGFGLSDRPSDADFSPEAHARRFRLWMEALDLRDVTLVVHDYGGPFALPMALERPGRVSRLVVLNSWMWSFEGNEELARKARFASGRLGRWMYRRLNASLRLLTPYAFGDRKKLTPRIHAQYLAPFPDADSRERVLWALARALLGSSDFYADLWGRRSSLVHLPTLLIWGMKDPAFPPMVLERWREALPHAEVVELPVGHWPQEEAPEQVTNAMEQFLQSASSR